MEAELVALAAAGATALVQQMVTEGWQSARAGVVRFFARGAADPDGVAAELESARAELVEAHRARDEAAAADVLAEWRARMRRALAADPRAAAELRALLAEVAPGEDAAPALTVHTNNITGGTQHGTVIQTGTTGSIHFGGRNN
ncbi:hypothetical protein [Streptomyces sp. CAU 1734]|uniref:hypothetical protein n=1 Tax=Streptomyces sp. CAU 1734 TaxID=3140360 RepID=UPI003260A742